MSTVSPLSSYWRHRASTVLPLDSATFSNAPAASGTFITVTDLPTTLSAIPTSSPTPSSSSSSLASSRPSLASSTSTSSFAMPTSSPFIPSSTSAPGSSEEGVAPMSNSYKIIIPSVFGALLLGMCLCIYAARLRRRSRANKSEKDLSNEEEGSREKGTRPNTGFGDYGKGRWSRRLTFKTGPDKIWKRLKDYEDSVKARAANDSHIPSLPPPAITREEASFTVPTFYHGQQGLPQGLPYGEVYAGPSMIAPNGEVIYDQHVKPNYTMLTRKPTVKLEPRIESQMAEERNTNDLSLAEMFEVDLDGEEEDQNAISPFDDDIYENELDQQQHVHALTHSLKSSSSRERINTSAYPFHPPAAAPAPDPVHLSVPETIDPFAESIDTSTVGNAMLSASPTPSKRKPVPETTLEVPVPTSTLLTPDFIASTSSDKRVTYRSPTESIYGCYQADDDRSASFVDFSVSPKTIV